MNEMDEEIANFLPKETDPINDLLQCLLSKKYALILQYMNFGDKLLALYRDSLYEHFNTHLEEERAMAYQITRKLVSRGADPNICLCDFKNVLCNKPLEMINCLQECEQELVNLWSQLGAATKEDFVLNAFAQDGAIKDQAHLEDMIRYNRAITEGLS